MDLSGQNFRSIAESRSFSFASSFSPEGKTGIGLFSLSGENKDIRFTFDSGRIFDPNNKYIYSYRDFDNIEISGDVEVTGYSYYINEEPFSYGNAKDDFKLQRVHHHSTGMQFSDVYTEIKGTLPSYFLDFPSTFISSGYHTGYLVNNSNDLGFEVLSADLVDSYTGFWKVTENDKTIAPSSSGKIVVQDISGLTLYTDHNYSLNIDTNFGRITSGVSATANPADFKRVLFDVTKTSSGLNSTGLTNVTDVVGGGNIWTDDPINSHTAVKFNTYMVDYLAYSGLSPSGDKPLYVSLEYLEGPTGDFFGGIGGTTLAYGDYVTSQDYTLTGDNGSMLFNTFVGAAQGIQSTGTTTGVVAGAAYIIGSGFVGETAPFVRISGIAHTGNFISGYAHATGHVFVYASGVTEGAIMSGVTGIGDFHNVPEGGLGLSATGSGLLAEYYGGSWNYGSEYVATTGLLEGFFSGQDMVAADLGSKFYQEYITGGIDATTTGGTEGTKWSAKLINSSLKAPSYPDSGVTGVTSHSGYWTGNVIASGQTYYSGDTNYTGRLSGYEKTFTGSFDMSTGVSGSFLTSGYYWGEGGNVGAEPYTGYKIYPYPYIMSSGEQGANVSIKFSSNHDFEPIVALLTISGMDGNVYQDHLTGVR